MAVRIIAAGDSFITRRLPEKGYEGFEELAGLILTFDAAFVNLESTFQWHEGTPAATSGGTWAMSPPETLDDIRRFGFNLFNTANNHSGDYSQDGVLATLRHLEERQMVYAGTGRNLTDATRAAMLETPKGRVAMVGVTATFAPEAAAGTQGPDVKGRPGLNPLRFKRIHHVNAQHFAMAKELADVTLINAAKELSIANGYTNPFPEGSFTLGNIEFRLTDGAEHMETVPNARDLARITAEVQEARRQADVVLVSLHAHEMRARKSNEPAEFLETFAHAVIDAGANAVIGHGPHEMRGIELYRGGVIFYSIGNFIFETETVAVQPADAFLNKGFTPETKVGEYMDQRSLNGTRGYVVQENIWRAVLPGFTVDNGRVTEVKLYPVDLGQKMPRSQRGLPRLTRAREPMLYLADLSKPYGTEITVDEEGVGTVRLRN